uniref:Uncharacterized protein n=1 Tax=Romanomermis culicivorax TaxID=13658 RepID=A0A915K2N8_ROMCU
MCLFRYHRRHSGQPHPPIRMVSYAGALQYISADGVTTRAAALLNYGLANCNPCWEVSPYSPSKIGSNNCNNSVGEDPFGHP